MPFKQSLTIQTASSISDGAVYGVPSAPIQFSAYLSGAGGSASVSIYVRESSGAPWYLRGSFALSGANARDQFTVTGESWSEVYASTTAISSATVTVVMGG